MVSWHFLKGKYISITNITTVASGIIELIGTGKEVYEVTVNAMDAMDAIEAKGVVKGSDKKEWVLAFVKSVVLGLG